jgi:hypothetical protein
LDVDMIRPTNTGIENIIFKQVHKGKYKFYVNNYDNGRTTGFKVQLEVNGEIYDFNYPTHTTADVHIVEVDYNGSSFTVIPKLEASSATISKQVWNLNTNQFHKVKTFMLSPNHWQQQTGNKHYMFFLENCISDESPRPFYNEFLTEQLMKERKVFEVLASKLKVEPNQNQLSGIGFSETQPNHLYVRVEGNFKRILKIKI